MQSMYSEKFSKKSIKPRRNLLPVMLQAFFIRKILEGTRRTLKGHWQGIRRTLRNPRHSGTRALEALERSAIKTLGHSGTRKALGHSGTQQVNRALGQGTRDSRLLIVFVNCAKNKFLTSKM